MHRTFKIHRIEKYAFNLFLLFLTVILFFARAHAKDENKKAPIDITSDSLEATGADVIFIGNVHAVYGDMIIDSDRMKLIYESEKKGSETKQEVKELIATGNVEFVQLSRRAWADKMVYVRADEVTTLTGNPRIREENNTISGDIIKIFMLEDRVEIKGNVKAVVNPDNKKDE